MIKPTVGRMVWFWEGVNQAQPMAAIVTLVHNDHMVNLSVFDSCGVQFSRTCVRLVQGDEAHIPAGHVPVGAYCEWMPYQVGQAKKDAIPGDSPAGTVKPATAVTDAMVSRFLGWKLPDDFAPDAGITFNPRNGQLMPTGTNLLHAGQARAMLEHVLGVAVPTTSIPLKSAMDIVCAGLRDDLDYAWSWHCNVAMAAVDAGCPRDVANEGAARFMQLLANVDTRKHDGFTQTQATAAPDTRPNPEQTAPAPSVEPENKQLVDQFAENMDFGDAIRSMKNGVKVARAGWNGKGMWLSLSCNPGGDAAAGSREISFENFWSRNNSEYARQNGGSAVVLPCITMKTATGEILMGWLASQTDMLAEDWVVVA